MNNALKALAWLSIPVSSFLYGVALFAPLFTISPGAGEFGGIIRLLAPSLLVTQTYTLAGSIVNLWTYNEHVLAVLLFLFSIALPIVKFVVLWGEQVCKDFATPRFLRIFKGLVRYSMVEVFLVAIMVFSIKGLPGGSRIDLHAGVWLFSFSVVLPLLTEKLNARSNLAM